MWFKKISPLILFSLMAMVLTNTGNAHIQEASKLSEVVHLFKNATPETLVLFDVDDALIMPQNDYRFTHPFRTKWGKKSKKTLSKERREFLISIIWEHRKVQLVDPTIKVILGDLAKRQIPTMALTAMYTGKFGKINAMEDWRLEELRGVGIDFAPLSPIKNTMQFEDLKGDHGMPLIKSGIILTAMQNKGLVLKKVLDALKVKPKEILFMDDALDHLKSVEALCYKLGIQFQGIHFVGAQSVPEPTWDEETEDKRIDILEKEERWETGRVIAKTGN